MEVKLVKLTTGEALIAQIELKFDNVQVVKPVVIAQVMTPEGPGIGFRPWLLGTNMSQEIMISKEHVVCCAELDQEIYNAYNSEYGSGLIMGNHAQGRQLREVVDYGS